ncbi:MAG: serine/threonine protein kinase [Planctomycetes bacterium]|nr:serine/threonine protein kinase [Planctomycetota bacterium]
MQPEIWQRARAVFEQALDLPAADREAFARERCGADPTLVTAVLDLLRADAAAELPLLDDAAKAWSSGHDLVGATIAGFQVLRRIGEGGMGTVYEARQQRPQRQVALKTLGVHLAGERARARFLDEAEILARLRHPAIAQVIDAGSTRFGERDVPWFAMELVEHPQSIDRFAREQALSVRAIAALMQGVADAVHHAHQRGVIHRDLKPANVLVDGGGQPKIIDFGIARFVVAADRPAHTRTGEFVGTLAYMSPERLEGSSDGADTSGDVYSLGVMLYELLARQLPFAAGDVPAARFVDLVRMLEPAPPSRLCPAVPTELDWVVGKAMAREPQRRYASAGELAQDLGRFLQREPVHAGPPSATYRLRRLAWRHRLVLGAAVVLFVAVAVGFVIATLGWQRVAAAERLASRRADTLVEVNQFQERILRGAYGSEKGTDVRLADVVDAAARDLDHATFADPLVEAGARNAIGASYIGIGRLADAERQLLRARELLRLLGGDPHAGVGISISGNLGVCYSALGKLDLAEREERQALTDRLAAFPVDSREVATAQNNLAVGLIKRGAFAEAFELASTAHATFTRRCGEGSEHTITACATMAGGLAGLNRLAEARVGYAEAMASAERHLHADHPARLAVLVSFSTFLFERGEIDAAVQRFEQVVAARERVLGPHHAQTLNALSNLASGQARSGKLAEAEATLRRAVAAYEALGIADGYDWVKTGQSLNAVVRRQGRAAEAETMARALLAIARRSLPDGHWLIGIVGKELGGCLCDLRRFDEAEPMLLQAHDQLTRTLHADDYRVQRTVQELVDLYVAWQRPGEAAIWTKKLGKTQ